MPILIKFNPKACTNPLLTRCFIALRLIPKNKFVAKSARCGSIFFLNTANLFSEGYKKFECNLIIL